MKIPKSLNVTIIKTISAIIIFILFWILFQAPYQFNIVDIIGLKLDHQTFFIIYTTWILLVTAIVIGIWKLKINDFSFLKIKNKKWLLFYVIPIILSIILIPRGDIFGTNSTIYILFLSLTTFVGQDLITFGIFQRYLEINVNKKVAAVIVLICFFLVHFIFITPSLDDLGMIGIYLIGFTIFSWLRYKTGNIYLLSMIHISFGLVMSLI